MKVKKKILSFMLIVNILTINIFYIWSSCFNVYAASAAGSVASNIAAYFLGTVGALDTSSGGSISGVTTSVKDRVAQAVASYLGTGIYTDSNDNYVFSGEATQGLYEALYNTNQGNFRVISDWGGAIARNALPLANCGFLPANFFYFNDNSTSVFNQYNNYICALDGIDDGSGTKYLHFIIFNIPNNFAYIAFDSNNTCRFYDVNSNIISVACKIRTCSFNGSSYNVSSWQDANSNMLFSGESSAYTNLGYLWWAYFYRNTTYMPKNLLYNYLEYTQLQTGSAFKNSFPFHTFWSNRSIIMGNTVAGGTSGYQSQNSPGIIVSNTYNNIPTISSNAITNNNWNNIYNNYVTNVNQNYTDLGGDSENIDYSLLQSLMAKFSKNIVSAVESGTDDIENAIFTTNDWLRRVYERCGQIADLVTESNTTLDNIESMLAALSRIESTLSSELTQLQQTYTLLGQILTAIQGINSGGGSGGGSSSVIVANDWPDLVIELNNLPNADILDFIDKGDILKDILMNSVPFCFVGFIGVIINGFSATPVTPRFEIPFKMTNNLQYEENVVIDLTQFSSIHDILIGLQVIAFVIWLIYITFALSKVLYQFLS